MAYTPREWTYGDKITADSLNNIEDGIQEALECCADKGYECTETRTSLFDGNVTTTNSGDVADGAFSAYFDLPNKAVVTFNGVEYTCDSDGWNLGDDSFVACPFFIMLGLEGSNPRLQTQSAGTYTVKVEAVEESVDTSACFGKAVKRFTGFDCEYRELFEETVTVDDTHFVNLSWEDPIDAENIRVTFNGVEYECERRTAESMSVIYEYGAEVVGEGSTYPFTIRSNNVTGSNLLTVEQSGTYTIKVEIVTSNTTSCFEQAVKSVAKGALIINLHDGETGGNKYLITDKRGDEIYEAYNAGRRILIKEHDPNLNKDVFFEVYSLSDVYIEEAGNYFLVMKATYFYNDSPRDTSSPYWDTNPPTIYSATYSDANFSPYLSRFNGVGIS